jgi:hypothetical protein
MIEPGRDLDLAQEALGSDRRRKVRGKHLHGDPAGVFAIQGQVHRAHAAATELALDRVTPWQRRCNAEEVRQGAQPAEG